MSRGVDLQNVLRRVKEGRGHGSGAEYRPYIQAKDVPSKGLTTRGKGWKTGRVHHFLSQLELDYLNAVQGRIQAVYNLLLTDLELRRVTGRLVK